MPIREQQKTNKQHPVPQNIMDVEFKLVGSLTMRQFVYLVVFAIMAYMAKLSVPQPFTWFFVFGIALAGIALAFVPVEERGLDEWLVNFIKAINSPTERIWKKEIRLPQAFSYNQQLLVVQKELITLAPTTSRRKLEEFLQQEDKNAPGDPLDILENAYAEKLRLAYETVAPERVEERKVELVTESPLQKGKEVEGKLEIPKVTTPTTDISQGPSKKESPVQDLGKVSDLSMKPKVTQEKPDKMAQIIKARMSHAQIKLPDEPARKTSIKLHPVESHAGRRFVNLTPIQGQIILPIRGEKVIQTEEQASQEYLEKQKKLQDMLDQNSNQKGSEQQPKFYKSIPSMINKPNMVSGVIKNRRDEHLENVVLVIKNEKGETIRALKTNKLGNFMVSSPIPNGEYKIEIDKTNDTGLTFDIIPFSANGSLLPSLEIIGH
jgi:hypothetical protein